MEQTYVIETAINSLLGVISSKVVWNNSSQSFEEVHILVEANRNPKQVSKDVQTLFAVQFNHGIDHRIISVVAINNAVPKLLEPRPKFIGIEHAIIDGEFRVAVHLRAGERLLVGKIEGLSSSRRNLRSVVEASIQAVQPLLKKDESLYLEDLDLVPLNKTSVTLVALTYLTKGNETCLVGSSVVTDNRYESVVKATLDAVNRVLFC